MPVFFISLFLEFRKNKVIFAADMKKYCYVIALLLCCTLLSGCDKLDDGNDEVVTSILPGTWAFSYTLKGDAAIGVGFDYEQVIFGTDGTCAITYLDTYEPLLDDEGNPVKDEEGNTVYVPVYGALKGTYQAGSAVIKIVSSDIGGQERTLLWRILSFTARQVVAEYDFDVDGQPVTAVVTLDKL